MVPKKRPTDNRTTMRNIEFIFWLWYGILKFLNVLKLKNNSRIDPFITIFKNNQETNSPGIILFEEVFPPGVPVKNFFRFIENFGSSKSKI